MVNFQLFLRFLAVRLLLAICIKSYAQPDEFWQGPEIAHREIYGYGHLTWEWTYGEPLRSPIYHSLFSGFYKILKTLSIDNDFLVSYGPRMVQSIITAIYDVFLVKLLLLEGISNQNYIILVNYTSWFSIYIMSRTLINNFETSLFVIALYYWRKFVTYGKTTDNMICRLLVVFSFAARGTSIVPWIFVWPFHLMTYKTSKIYWRDKIQTLFINISTVCTMILFSICVDSLYHGKLTWCVWNFTKFNLLEGGASFYGEHSMQWLFGLLIPYLFLGWIIFMPIGIFHYIKVKQNANQHPEAAYMCLFFMAAIALSAHKEDRFLLPMFPIFILWICFALEYTDKNIDKLRLREKYEEMKTLIRIKRSVVGLALISNLVMLVFVVIFKDVGALATIEKLRDQPNLRSVQFFVQCHSTPYYSYLHRDIQMKFPDCSPFQRPDQSENSLMYQNTSMFVEQTLGKYPQLPSHIVIYDFLYEKVKDQLNPYKIVESTFHGITLEASNGYFKNVNILILSLQKY